MSNATRISELTAAVLNAEDPDDVLDLLADSTFEILSPDSLLVLLPLNDSTWVCELVRGRYQAELLGASVSHSSEAADSAPLPFVLDHDSQETLATLTWGDLTRALADEDLPAPEGSTSALVAFPIDAGAARRGLLIAVRFADEDSDATAAFTDAENVSAASLASLFSFALNGSTGRSAIEDDLNNERNRIARDLHDLAIQELFGVGMQLETVMSQASRFPEYSDEGPVATSLKDSVAGIERSIAEIRGIVQSLRNETVEVTLSQRLRHECGLAIAGLGFVPSLHLQAPVAELDAIEGELKEDVVAVVKECLANVARHAHASAVSVSITLFKEGVDTVIQVNVSDNGRGIDPSITRRSGLANMSARARRHLGWVDFYSLDPGTMVSWRATIIAE
ncbi:sensor histidine kinase [Dermabacter hominis]|uniref:sensor histidine kinase n=1 Tax=Dermabacter hominis TaxID=36740 RepID=UPI0021AE4AF4|nr:histidine kinase [Dermabacter hominis]MCT2025761.1 histidine kinase [Dermabacter hominis]